MQTQMCDIICIGRVEGNILPTHRYLFKPGQIRDQDSQQLNHGFGKLLRPRYEYLP